MATQSPNIVLDITAIAVRLLEARETAPRARIIAHSLAALLPGSAVNVYMVADTTEGPVWTVHATIGDAAPGETVPLTSGVLGALVASSEPLLFAGRTLIREQYAHLNVRKTLQSLAYLPLVVNGALIGAIEILSFEEPLAETHLNALQGAGELAGSALNAAHQYRSEERR